MKQLMAFGLCTLIVACGGDNNSPGQFIYVSCQINTSQAYYLTDREIDVQQCWDVTGDGYQSQVTAVQWCDEQVESYLSTNYAYPHAVSYTVETAFCPIIEVDGT